MVSILTAVQFVQKDSLKIFLERLREIPSLTSRKRRWVKNRNKTKQTAWSFQNPKPFDFDSKVILVGLKSDLKNDEETKKKLAEKEKVKVD